MVNNHVSLAENCHNQSSTEDDDNIWCWQSPIAIIYRTNAMLLPFTIINVMCATSKEVNARYVIFQC